MNRQKQMSESYGLGMFLAAAGGFLDAYTFMLRGGVFSNAQTGNVVRVGVALALQDWSQAGRCAVSILTYTIGVFLTEIIHMRYRNASVFHWRQFILCIEIAVMIVVAVLPLGTMDALANILISFVCALQAQSFRKIDGNTMVTTMCTGNLRSGTALLSQALAGRDRARFRSAMEYYGIILFFMIGAAAGALISLCGDSRVALVPAALMLAALLLMFIRHRRSGGDTVPEQSAGA